MIPINEIAKIAKHIPLDGLQDIYQRIADRLASGGEVDDQYIQQQLRYAKKFVRE
jgi:hypothetical protein